MTRIGTVLSVVTLSGCGLVLAQNTELTEWREAMRTPSSYVVEGEVRDQATFLVPDAIIESSTNVPAYVPRASVDGHGRFRLLIEARRTVNSAVEQGLGEIMFNDPHLGEVWVQTVSYRARAGDRCSDTRREALRELPGEPIMLWLRPCGERDLSVRP